MRGAWRLGALVALVCFLAFGAAPARAQDDPATSEPIPLALVSQTPFVDADGEMELRFSLGELAALTTTLPAPAEAAGDPSSDAAGENDGAHQAAAPFVVVTVYGRIDDSGGLDTDPEVAINRLPNIALSAVPVDGDIVTIRMPIRSSEQFDERDRILIPDSGVYPLKVEVRAGGVDGEEVLGSLRTEMIRLPLVEPGEGREPSEPRVGPPLAVVVPIGGTGSTVAEATELLSTHPDLPATAVVANDALAELEGDPALAASFVTALGSRSVVVSVRPQLDPSSLAAIGRLDRYRQAIASTRAASAALGLPSDDATITVGAAQTIDGAVELRSLGIDRTLDSGSLVGAETVRLHRLPTPDGPLLTLHADPVWLELRAGIHAPAARAHRLLARLALAEPGAAIVLNASAGGDGGAQALDTLFAALAEPSILTLPLAELAPRATAAQADPARQPAQDLSAVTDDTATTVALLASYETFYAGGPGSPGSYGAELDAALSLDADPSGRVDRVRALNQLLDAELATIALPPNQTVTLAARSAAIPLTIENGAAGARQVLLEFQSDKIAVEEDGQLITVEQGTSSIDVHVEARSLGVSPLQVSVLTPDGQRVLSTTRFEVRSTAIPGLGLLISAVGLLLLGGWWYVSIRRKRSPPDPATDDTEPRAPLDPDASDRTDVLASGSV